MIISDKDFENKIWLQHCNDSIKILKKTNIKDKNNRFFYECQFVKYPYNFLGLKSSILRGIVNNPLIEEKEFINKIWPQHCGDSLKILKKDNNLYKCEFLKYPIILYKTKNNIIKGEVNNPKIEENKFIRKIFKQNCGDSLLVLNKTNKQSNNKSFLFNCKFINYPCEILARKDSIIAGNIDNPNLPWKNKENLLNYIKNNFNYKPSILELSKKLNIHETTIGQSIRRFDLEKYINYYISTQELELRNYIQFLNKNLKIISNEEILDGKEIDIYIPNLKLGFEYNGNFWHSNIEKYGKDNYYHQEKSIIARDKGIKLIHIFEYEYNLNKVKIENFIKSKLGIFEKIIGARKCIIKEIDSNIYKIFCDNNHLQGSCGAKVKLGLFYKNELIQIMSFGVPRFTDKYEWEIIRECSKLGYCIIGGKEKLWKYFIKNYRPKNCISYCDFSKFTGDSYLKLGFKFERLNKPGFVWYDNKLNCVYWRNPYHNREMKDKGYLKIYDCGQLVFVWN